jgi:glycerol uptake facilitator-like aquaporin
MRCVYVGYAVNPARDLGPRIMTAMVGYGAQGPNNSIFDDVVLS